RSLVSGWAMWGWAPAAGSRRSASVSSRSSLRLVPSCVAKCAPPKCGCWPRKSMCAWMIPARSIGRCRQPHSAPRGLASRGSGSTTAASSSAMRLQGRRSRWRSSPSTATSDGSFVAGGEPFSFRISGSRAGDDGNLKVRLAVDPADRPLTTEVEGLLGFARGVPQFDGTFSAARPVGVTLAGGQRVMSDPWQLAGKVQATPAAAKLQDLALLYGPEERAVVFNGKADLILGVHPQLEGEISARQVDVDRMLAAPDVTHRPPLIMLK